jgi:MFS family permease
MDVQLADENIFDVLREILAQTAAEAIRLLPKIFIALIVIVLAFLLINLLNFSFRKLLKLAKLDAMFKQLSGFSLPFSVDSLIIFLADLGVALIALYGLVNLFLGTQYLQLMNEGIYYGARVVSVVVIALVIFAIFNALIGRIKVESRLRSYAMLIVLLLITAMLIDITALSDPVKGALTLGLSIGVGIAIGVFAIWFFFHEYLDKSFKIESVVKPQEENQQGN